MLTWVLARIRGNSCPCPECLHHETLPGRQPFQRLKFLFVLLSTVVRRLNYTVNEVPEAILCRCRGVLAATFFLYNCFAALKHNIFIAFLWAL